MALATTTPGANKIPQADASGKISRDWLAPIRAESGTDSDFAVNDEADTTKKLKFSVGAQATASELTLAAGAQTASRTLSVPVLSADAVLAVLIANLLAIPAGGATSATVKVGGALAYSTTTTGNVGGGEDTLMTTTVAANTLAANGDSLEAVCAGTFGASANNKRLRVRFGSTVIFDSGALAATLATDWTLEIQVIRTGAATQKCNVRLTTSFATLLAFCDYSTAGETLSGALALAVTGEGTADNDIVAETWKVCWTPAP